jgi:hypothetical protein
VVHPEFRFCLTVLATVVGVLAVLPPALWLSIKWFAVWF